MTTDRDKRVRGSVDAAASGRSARDAEAHLLQIAHCPIMIRCLESANPTGPCAKVVLWQWHRGPATLTSEDRIETWRRFHQLPEPWNGHLVTAAILFVSSNPSIGGTIPPNPREAPSKRHLITCEWGDEEVAERHENAFSHYMEDRVRAIGAKATAYWAGIRARAQELVPGRRIIPGDDYAITEAVRCKSEKERGVKEARATCSQNYLGRTIELSGARVVVGVGLHARKALTNVLDLRRSDGPQEVQIAGRRRLVTFLPHPNAFAAKTFAKTHSQDDLDRLRTAVEA